MITFQKLKMNKLIVIGVVLAVILLIIFTMPKRDVEKETATKIYNELKQMQDNHVSEKEQNTYWENLKSEGILTTDVQKIIYEMAAEKKQEKFLSK